MRALGREPVLPAVLRRGVLLPSASVRPLVADALAPAHGGGQARRADPGEPRRRDPHGSRQACGLPAGGHRHDRAGEGDCLPDGRQADAIALVPDQRDLADAHVRLAQGYAPRLGQAHQALAGAMLGRVIRDITRKIVGRPELADVFALPLSRARRVKDQRQRQRGRKLYSLHAPEVECIGKGKAHKPYEFGVKVSVATPLNGCRGGQFVAHVKALPGNPYDGHTLAAVLPDIENTIGAGLERIVTDAGYKGHNAPKHQRFKVYVAGQKRGLTTAIKRAFRGDRPWSPRSVTSRTSTGWGATTWPGELAMPPTPCSRPRATTSASSSGGSLSCCASSWPSSQPQATRTGPSQRPKRSYFTDDCLVLGLSRAF